MSATATATHTVEHLNRMGDIHVVAVDGETVIVHDHVSHYQVSGRQQESYSVLARFGRAISCSCPAQKFNRRCRHKLAVEAVAAKW